MRIQYVVGHIEYHEIDARIDVVEELRGHSELRAVGFGSAGDIV